MSLSFETILKLGMHEENELLKKWHVIAWPPCPLSKDLLLSCGNPSCNGSGAESSGADCVAVLSGTSPCTAHAFSCFRNKFLSSSFLFLLEFVIVKF